MSDDAYMLAGRTVKRLAEVTSRVLPAMTRVPRLKRRVFDDIEPDTAGGTGGSGCCCNELNCLRVPGLPSTTVLKPSYYEFTPSALVCGCDPSETAQATVQLYPTTDPNIWEQNHGSYDDSPICLGSATDTEACTVTATWKWVGGPCTDTYSVICVDGIGWVANPNTGFPNYAPVAGLGVCTECGGPATPPPDPCDSGHNGNTYTSGCLNSTVNPHWELQGVDEADCICTPAEPDFDGTEINQTAETTCDGTKTVDGSDTLQVAFWRLTIVPTLDSYGCDSTRLEFIIGSSAVLTYYLTGQCGHSRPFCGECTNSFKVSNCKPRCTGGPTVICLHPQIPGYVTISGGKMCCDDTAPLTAITQVPANYLLSNGSIVIDQATMDALLVGMWGSVPEIPVLPTTLLDTTFLLQYDDNGASPLYHLSWLSDPVPLNTITCGGSPGGSWQWNFRLEYEVNQYNGGDWGTFLCVLNLIVSSVRLTDSDPCVLADRSLVIQLGIVDFATIQPCKDESAIRVIDLDNDTATTGLTGTIDLTAAFP